MKYETTNLSAYLRNTEGAILRHWRESSERHDPAGTHSRLSYREFYDDVPILLAVLANYLDTDRNRNDLAEASDAIRRHGRARWLQRFDLEELLRDWGRLHQAVLAAVSRYFDEHAPDAREDRADALQDLTCFFTEAASVSAGRYNELRRKEALGELRELKQMKAYFEQIESALRNLVSDASHDIGSSLTAISGVSQVLKQDDESNAAAAMPEFGSIIEESVRSASGVLELLAQLTRLDSGEARLDLETVDLGTFLRTRIREIGEDNGIDVRFGLTALDPFEARVDPGKLRRTLEVLIHYAAAGPDPETVRIDCGIEGDSWTLTLEISRDADAEADHLEVVERHREINQLLLKRLCFVQKALIRFEGESADAHGEKLLLRFPLSYAEEAEPGSVA